MKILTTTQKKVFHPEFGWLKQINFHLFGFKVWTENHFIQDEIEERTKNIHDLEEVAMYQEWREKMKLMRLTDEQFDLILNTRF